MKFDTYYVSPRLIVGIEGKSATIDDQYLDASTRWLYGPGVRPDRRARSVIRTGAGKSPGVRPARPAAESWGACRCAARRSDHPIKRALIESDPPHATVLSPWNYTNCSQSLHLSSTKSTPASTKHFYNIYTMLGQRRRRWADVV